MDGKNTTRASAAPNPTDHAPRTTSSAGRPLSCATMERTMINAAKVMAPAAETKTDKPAAFGPRAIRSASFGDRSAAGGGS